MLSLYRLDSVTPLNVRSLSHKARPERMTKLGNFIVSPTETVFEWSRNLTCHWDQVLTFELACTSDRDGYRAEDCGFEWWQGKESEDPSMGMPLQASSFVFVLTSSSSNLHDSALHGVGLL